ncbi:putative disease resistance protein RGA4 [Momordica charantia]|uniref:Disease resistance protein RGA4 n=1 Tax=Momordica charantia TaxID=3673 RepID=A0A6J1DHT2_MOMCH|nr:putative disease resistance protein RGA4 [Momordica charantia]
MSHHCPRIVCKSWKKAFFYSLHIFPKQSFGGFISISPPETETETMAEGVLVHVAGNILMKLGSITSQMVGMVPGLEDDLTKLTATVSAIKNVLVDAEECQTKTHALQNWLQKLEEVFYDVEDMLDEFSYEALRRELTTTREKNTKKVRIFFSGSNLISFNYRMTCKMKNIWERLDAVDAEKEQFHLRENYGSFDQITMERNETCSFSNEEEVIGRDDDKKKVKHLLLDMDMNVMHNVLFVMIVGMDGIGKTTLAKSLYNDDDVSKCFDSRIWIWVSGQFEVKVIVKKMIESATGSSINPNVKGMEALLIELQKVIRGKKYMLVMDDVWNESGEKWNELKHLLMGGARGSKILITKRDNKVATEIESMTSLLTLEGLRESKSWSLFRSVAFKEGNEPANPNLIKLGKEILVGCGGVPLVIRQIGRLLSSTTSEKEWMSFKENELLEALQQNGIDNNYPMTSILKLSYNHLPSNLKPCFAYLSLFPKGTSLKINDLIRQWIAQGFIESSNGS